jgi:hypothetical protein
MVLESIFKMKESTLQEFNIGTSETVAVASVDAMWAHSQ